MNLCYRFSLKVNLLPIPLPTVLFLELALSCQQVPFLPAIGHKFMDFSQEVRTVSRALAFLSRPHLANRFLTVFGELTTDLVKFRRCSFKQDSRDVANWSGLTGISSVGKMVKLNGKMVKLFRSLLRPDILPSPNIPCDGQNSQVGFL